MSKLKLIPQAQSETYVPSHGSYYVRKLKSGWSLYHQTFNAGKKTDTRVEPLAYSELGFKPQWSLDEARERCKRLNKEKTVIQGQARKAAARLTQMESIDDVLFPAPIVQAFSKRLEQENEGTELHLKKVNSHFLKVQELCKDLQIIPFDYKENEKIIYKWFSKNKISLDYTQKLISLLNRWGTFVSKRDGRYFEPVAPVRGISREKIREAHIGKSGVRTESKPITPDLLRNKKELLSLENHNFLFVCLWFGLRPSETKALDAVEIQKNDEGLEFLIVYQTKLVSIEKSKRFKAIPILFKEQKEAVKILRSKNLKAPIYKKMNSVFGEEYGLYGGRKAFTDLMLSKGYAIEDISLWLGHTSIETTWTHYKNKNAVSLPSPKKKFKPNIATTK